MARARGFWDSFYQSWQQGDQMSERFRGLAQRRDIGEAAKLDQEVSNNYSPEQIASLTDEAEKAGGQWSEADQAYKMPNGGLQAPTNTPTWENGAYQTGQGQVVNPNKQYSLGGVTQDKEFGIDEVRAARAEKIAGVYEQYGDVDKATNLRASAQQMKLGKLQYDAADMEFKQAKNVNDLFKLRQKFGTMAPSEQMSAMIDFTDKINDDGITHGMEDLGNGTFRVTEMKDNQIVGSKVVTPEEAFMEAFRYSSPAAFDKMMAQDNANRTYQAGRDDQAARVKMETDKFDYQKEQDTITNRRADADQVARAQYYKGIVGARGANSSSGDLTPEEQAKASQLYAAFDSAETPEQQAFIGRQITALQTRVALRQKKFPSMNSITSGKAQSSAESAILKRFEDGKTDFPTYQAELAEYKLSTGIGNALGNLPPKPKGGGKKDWYMNAPQPAIPAPQEPFVGLQNTQSIIPPQGTAAGIRGLQK